MIFIENFFSNESDVLSMEKTTKSRNNCQLSTTIWMYSKVTYLFHKLFSKQNLKNELHSTTWKFPNANRNATSLVVRPKRHNRLFTKNNKLQCFSDWLLRGVKKSFATCFIDKTLSQAILIFCKLDQSSMSWCSSLSHFQKLQLKQQFFQLLFAGLIFCQRTSNETNFHIGAQWSRERSECLWSYILEANTQNEAHLALQKHC